MGCHIFTFGILINYLSDFAFDRFNLENFFIFSFPDRKLIF